MSRIYLIRHGTTVANERHLYCGSTDLPLSEAGRAALLPLEGIYADRWLTSGMRRTNETMELLFGRKDYTVCPAFREIDFGKFEMHSYEQLKDDPEYQAWITGDNQRNVPPGGESGEAMTARVVEAFRSLAAQPGDTVLVTHGGVIAAIMQELFPQEGKNLYQWQPRPGKGYCITDGTYEPLA